MFGVFCFGGVLDQDVHGFHKNVCLFYNMVFQIRRSETARQLSFKNENAFHKLLLNLNLKFLNLKVLKKNYRMTVNRTYLAPSVRKMFARSSTFNDKNHP